MILRLQMIKIVKRNQGGESEQTNIIALLRFDIFRFLLYAGNVFIQVVTWYGI